MANEFNVLRAQQAMLRGAVDPLRGGVPLKVIAWDSGVPEASLRSYAREDGAAMPVGVLARLCGVVDPALLSLLLPDGFALVAVPAGIDHGTFAARAMDFAAHYAAARHEDSEDGSAIGAGENAALCRLRVAAVGEG